MDDSIWISSFGGVISVSWIAIYLYIRYAKKQRELADLEPVMFPHPHPRPPLPPSRISSLTNLVEMVIEVDDPV